MKMFYAKSHEVDRKWLLIDATDKVLGRLAAEIAHRLRGKHKPEYTPHVDTGDYIIVINADNMRFTGNKLKQKEYFHHTGYPGGLKSITLDKFMAKSSEKVLEHAVKGMLPKNSLGRSMFGKMKIYPGAEHPHEAQMPEKLIIPAIES